MNGCGKVWLTVEKGCCVNTAALHGAHEIPCPTISANNFLVGGDGGRLGETLLPRAPETAERGHKELGFDGHILCSGRHCARVTDRETTRKAAWNVIMPMHARRRVCVTANRRYMNRMENLMKFTAP